MKAPIFSAIVKSKEETTDLLEYFAEEDQNPESAHDPNACKHCGGSGMCSSGPYGEDPGCNACGGDGKRRLGYWNNYGRDDDHDD